MEPKSAHPLKHKLHVLPFHIFLGSYRNLDTSDRSPVLLLYILVQLYALIVYRTGCTYQQRTRGGSRETLMGWQEGDMETYGGGIYI